MFIVKKVLIGIKITYTYSIVTLFKENVTHSQTWSEEQEWHLQQWKAKKYPLISAKLRKLFELDNWCTATVGTYSLFRNYTCSTHHTHRHTHTHTHMQIAKSTALLCAKKGIRCVVVQQRRRECIAIITRCFSTTLHDQVLCTIWIIVVFYPHKLRLDQVDWKVTTEQWSHWATVFTHP